MLALALLACNPDPTSPTSGETGADTDTDTDTDTQTETGTPPIDDGLVHDPLSMPAEPTLDPAEFASAEDCGSCHPDHAAEWRTSMHAYAMVDPLFQALVGVRQADLEGTEDQFCVQCHSAIGTRGGEIVPGFSFDDLSPIVKEGITCTSCHSITEVVRDYNSGHVLDPSAPIQGSLQDPQTGGAHLAEYNPAFETSEFCGGCHDVIETDGLDLERPYREWTQSPSALAGETCQDCHMRTIERPAANFGPVRTTHEHRWVGVDVPLVDGFISEGEEQSLREATRELLTGVADLELSAPGAVSSGSTFDVNITAHNRILGHNLPTGSTFLRQVWLELVATDAKGTVLYQTGDLDANGDLKDHWSELEPFGDHDLISLSSGFVDGDGERTLFPWTADEHTTGAIPPGYSRTWSLFVPTEGATGPVTIEAHLRFRALPPHLLRLVGLGDRVEDLEIHDLASDVITIDLGP
ncbi:MAG: multiheme c-type cytochrome [Myxococcota bacterium]